MEVPQLLKTIVMKGMLRQQMKNSTLATAIFFEISNCAVYINNDYRGKILLVEYSSFVECYFISSSFRAGALYFSQDGQSVLDHVCFSFCWSLSFQSWVCSAYSYGDQNRFKYVNYLLSCSTTNCGKNVSSGYAVSSNGCGQQKLDMNYGIVIQNQPVNILL